MTPDPLPFPEPDPWTTATWRQAVEALPLGWEGTTYEAAARVGLPEPADPKHSWGALGQLAHRWGLLLPVGFTQSQRPGSRGSAVQVWRRVVPGEQTRRAS